MISDKGCIITSFVAGLKSPLVLSAEDLRPSNHVQWIYLHPLAALDSGLMRSSLYFKFVEEES